MDIGYYSTNLLEILLIFLLLYGFFRFLRGSRGEGIIKGFTFLFVVIALGSVLLTRQLGLYRIEYLLAQFMATSLLALVILFQPEIRNGLVQIGRYHFFRALRSGGDKDLVEQVVKAVEKLSANKFGALIAIEREIGLGGYAERGVRIDSKIEGDLLVSIFRPGSPLHDGAVVIRGDRIAAAVCLFPLTENPDLDKNLGTRHRAAIGLTEETDALTIAVSEGSGAVSIAERATLRRAIDIRDLKDRLVEIF